MKSKPVNSVKDEANEFDKFKDFMTRLVAVPHSEIKEKLEAEKKAKQKAKTLSASHGAA